MILLSISLKKRGASLSSPMASSGVARRSLAARLRVDERRRGFTLIELIVSLAIGSIVALTLTTLLNQSYASQRKLESLTHLYERATLFFTQLERDLMGATVPIENVLAQDKSGSAKASSSAKATADMTPDKREGGKDQPAEQVEKEKGEAPYKPFDKVFYLQRANNQLFFSWVTRNPLQLYWGSSVGVARPRIARVMYRLEADPKDKTLFKLVRTEGFDLTYTPYEKHTDQKYKGYALVDDVKSIKITCIVVQEKKQENEKDSAANPPAAKAAGSKKPPVTEVKTFDSWEWPRSKEDKKDKKEAEQDLAPLPNGVRIELVLWDAATEREVTFEYGIYIPALPDLQRDKKDAGKKPADKAKLEQAPEGANAPGGRPTNSQQGGGPIVAADTGTGKPTPVTNNIFDIKKRSDMFGRNNNNMSNWLGRSS